MLFNYFRALIFLSSFSPAFLLLAIKLWLFNDISLLSIVFLAVFFFLLFLILGLFVMEVGKISKDYINITNVRREDTRIVLHLLVQLMIALCFDLRTMISFIAVSSLLILCGVVKARIAVNPLIYLFGYRIVSFSQAEIHGTRFWMIVKRGESISGRVSATQVDNSLFWRKTGNATKPV
jgi:hypothetical protein